MSEYDVYLNSVGYMLAKRADGQLERGAAQERKSNPFTRYLSTDEQYVRVPFRVGDGGGCAEYDGSHRYAYGQLIDTRGGAAIGGPKVYSNNPTLGNYQRVTGSTTLSAEKIDNSGSQMGLAERFLNLDGAINVRTAHVMVHRHTPQDYAGASDFTVAIYDDSSGKPGSALANGSVTVSLKQDNDLFLPWPDRWRSGDWFWLEVVFPDVVALSNSTYYWLVVINNQAKDLYWAQDAGGAASFQRSEWNGSAWSTAHSDYGLMFKVYPGSLSYCNSWPRCFCEFAGTDGIQRLYAGLGYKVVYFSTLDTGYVLVPNSKTFSTPVLDLKVFNGKMYAALGPDTDMWYTDGASATTTWAQETGEQANALALHDYMLWKADVATVKGYDGTTWGPAFTVGDPGTPVQAMVSHGGKLFCAKPEGIFEVTYPSDYPGGTTVPVANLMLDFSTELAARTWMLDWHGGLYFPGYGGVYELKSGILRNIWTEKIDEGAQEIAQVPDYSAIAGSYTRPRRWSPIYDAEPGGWSAACGTTRGIVFAHSDSGPQRVGLWWYDGRNWHDIGPVDALSSWGDGSWALGEYCLAVHLEDLGGGRGRLWHGEGPWLNFADIPTWTNDRWMDPNAEFRSSVYGALGASVVCPRFTVEQRSQPLQFCKVGVTGQRGEADNTIKVYYRLDAASSWTLLGTATLLGDDYDELDFPASTTGRAIQLKAELVTAQENTRSPRLEQLDLLYQPMPEAFTTYQLIIHAAPDLPLHDGGVDPRSTAEILDDLRALIDNAGFAFIDPAGASHTVRVTGLSVQHVRQETAAGDTPPTEAYAIVSLLDV